MKLQRPINKSRPIQSPKGTYTIVLPTGVHGVNNPNGGKYWYYQVNRNTPLEGPRHKLPYEPGHPEFHSALNRILDVKLNTFDEVAQSFMGMELPARVARGEITQSTMKMLCHNLKQACKIFGKHRAADVTSKHVEELVHCLANQKGKANNLIGALGALSGWGVKEKHFPQSLVVGVKRYDLSDRGHKPWTLAQQAAAVEHLRGPMRRVYFLGRYTGLRGSDIIRLGETFIDRDKFVIRPQKNGKWIKEIYVAIDPLLAAEMATWERSPGPYVRTEMHGVSMKKRTLDDYWKKAADEIPELAETTLHGLRATRIIELRAMKHAYHEIGDQVGLSAKMVERYCRFADRESESDAMVIALAEHRKNKNS